MMHVLRCSICNLPIGLATIPHAVCKKCAMQAHVAFNRKRVTWGITTNVFKLLLDALNGHATAEDEAHQLIQESKDRKSS